MEQIGKYEIVSETGTGVFGTVYRARVRYSGEERALRVLPRPATVPLRNRLVIETFAASKARQISDCGSTGDKLFVAGPWIDGKPLDKVEPKPAMPERIETLAAAAEALAAIHATGVLHRNLHPGNIFALGGGKAAITDATLSFLPCAESLGRSAVRLDYLAPEQFLGGPVDGRTDLFALGVVAFQYLGGKHPFPGDGRARAMIEDAPLSLQSIDRGFTGMFDVFFAKALAKDPASRFASAPEMAADLRKLQWVAAKQGKKAVLIAPPKAKMKAEAAPAVAAAASAAAPGEATPFRPRNLTRQIAAGVLAAAGVAAATVFVANRDVPKPQSQQAVQAVPAPEAKTQPQPVAAKTDPEPPIVEAAPPAAAEPAPAPAVDPVRLLRRAEERFNQGNYRAALSSVNTVLAADPANAEAKRWRVRILQAQAAEAKLSQ